MHVIGPTNCINQFLRTKFHSLRSEDLLRVLLVMMSCFSYNNDNHK